MKRNILLSRASFEDKHIDKAAERRAKLIKFIEQSSHLRLKDIGWEICDYITLDNTLKREILTAYCDITSYIKRDVDKRPLNVLLFASAGSGKSFLVKCLSKQQAIWAKG